MSLEPFDYAKDAILRFEHVGYSDWSSRKREALHRIAFAQSVYESQLHKAKMQGMARASLIIFGFNLICLVLYLFHRGAI